MRNHNNTATAEIEIQAEPSQPIDERSESGGRGPAGSAGGEGGRPLAIELPWHAEVSQFLTHAAELCVEHGVDLDSFMKGAWSAYVETRPGMRDYLEEIQLRNQLDEIRKSGQMGEA